MNDLTKELKRQLERNYVYEVQENKRLKGQEADNFEGYGNPGSQYGGSYGRYNIGGYNEYKGYSHNGEQCAQEDMAVEDMGPSRKNGYSGAGYRHRGGLYGNYGGRRRGRGRKRPREERPAAFLVFS
uniref:Cold and drought-regulated protein CORA-like n=1 Tax=Strongyloides venezuelensis TaxID=75913 RepID=A0A0K0F3N9_STRVS